MEEIIFTGMGMFFGLAAVVFALKVASKDQKDYERDVRQCPHCGNIIPISSRKCPVCYATLPRAHEKMYSGSRMMFRVVFKFLFGILAFLVIIAALCYVAGMLGVS